MAVVYRDRHGWVVDHQQAVRDIYKDCKPQSAEQGAASPKPLSYFYRKELFAIHHPFRMDSQFERLRSISKSPQQEPRRRKFYESEFEDGKPPEIVELFFLTGSRMVKDQLLLAHGALVKAASGFFSKHEPMNDNNLCARSAAAIKGPADSLLEACYCHTESPDPDSSFLEVTEKSLRIKTFSEVVGKKVQHSGLTPLVASIGGHEFLLPPQSTFFLSDIANLKSLCCQTEIPFDSIVLDPPWQNKSVKRRKMYWCLDSVNLQDIPLPQLAAPGCLILIWLTSRNNHLRFVKEELFPLWHVQYITTWHWIKVTTTGSMVYSFDSLHKKPYELLLLGRYMKGAENLYLPDIDTEKIIVSIPCSIHSKKPPLAEILAPFLPEQPRCLELFSRNLWPRWTSWGNEVLKHQHTDFFKKTDDMDNQ